MDEGFQVLVDAWVFGFLVMFSAGLGIGIATWFRRWLYY